MTATERRLLFTCEHGGNRIPAAFAPLFFGKQPVLASHRGWDPGALLVARALSRALQAPLIPATTSRLLVDLNRSPHNPRVFSEWTRTLPAERRERLLERHHAPHWARVRAAMPLRGVATIHIAVHSFTPVLADAARPYAIGLLYDPKRASERRFVDAWQRQLRDRLPRGQVRRNAPYRGDADGLTTALRRERPADRYCGVELELNQAAIRTEPQRRALAALLAETLRAALDAS